MAVFGGGILKNVDAVSDALGKIEAKLKSIDALMGSLGKHSSNVSSQFTKASFSGGTMGGPGKSLGVGAPQFANPATFSGMPGGMTPPPPPGTPTAMPGGGMAYGPTRGQQIFQGATKVTLGLGAMAWNLLPGVAEARTQRQAMFSATLNMGSTMPNYVGLKDNMMNAFGGYATGNASQENVANYMAGFGMTLTSSSQSVRENAARFMGQSSAMSMLTGMSQEESARAGMSMASGPTANKLFMLGISSVNKDGSPKDFGATVKQIMDRTMKGNYSVEDVEKGLAPGGILRSNFNRLLGSENAAIAERYAIAIAGTGAQSGVLDTATLKEFGLTDPNRDGGRAKEMGAIGKRSQTTTDYADPLIDGWEKAIDAANAVEDVLQNLKEALAPLANLKGLSEGLLSQPSTGAIAGGAGAIASGLGSLLGGALGVGAGGVLGKLGKGATGLLKGGAKGGLLSRLSGMGGALVRGASRAVLPAGAALAGGATTNLLVRNFGSEEGDSDTTKRLASGGRLLGNIGTGALAGAALGSIIPVIGTAVGAALGGILGAAGGAYNMHRRGQTPLTYGNKANADAGGFFGSLGFGDGQSSGGSAGGSGPASGGGERSGEQKPAEKGGRTQGGGVAAALARAHAEARKGNQKRWHRYCARFVAWCWGLPNSGYRNASTQWRQTPKNLKYPGSRNAPAGAVYLWTGGSGGHGHAALSMGGGMVASNDVHGPGRISIVPLTRIINWCTFQGWAQPYYKGRLVGTVSGGGGDYVDVDSGGQPTGGRSKAADTGTGVTGMTATSVQPWNGGLITASSYGGVSSTNYSIASHVESSLEGRMTGGVSQVGSAGSTSDNKYNRQLNDSESRVGGQSADGAQSGGEKVDVSGAPIKGAKGVHKWAGVARSAMAAAGLPSKYFNLLMHRMQVESGGNPNALNDWDSNAKKGYPSKGLMQVIKPTFDSFAGPYKHLGQTHPFANIYAAIKWTQHKYGGKPGGIEKAWSGRQGYSQGAWRIPKDETANIHQGEMILPAAVAEAVRTSIRKSLAGQRSGGDGGTTHINMTVKMTGNMEYDARNFVRRVEEIIDQKNERTKIGQG